MPAAAFGLTQYATLEPGKVANVVVWAGDPLDSASVAEQVYIKSSKKSLRTRENELREKYRTVPPGP